jgi:hypothetical protein
MDDQRTDPPRALHVRSSMSAATSWDHPVDTGDTTQEKPIFGYEAAVTPSKGAAPVLVETMANNLVLSGSVGGTWRFCAEEGGLCYCHGIVRFGGFVAGLVAWSDVVRPSRNQVYCVPGAIFPAETASLSTKKR